MAQISVNSTEQQTVNPYVDMKILLTIALILCVYVLPASADDKKEPIISADRVTFLLIAGMLGIASHWVMGLLSSGANQKIVNQVNESLEPIKKSIVDLQEKNEDKNSHFSKTLNNINQTLIGIQSRQDSDKTYFEQGLANLGARLEKRIEALEKDSERHDKLIFDVNQSLGEIKGMLKKND